MVTVFYLAICPHGLLSICTNVVSMRPNDFEGNLIVLEGIDGAGTTTQTDILSEEIDAKKTSEPTETVYGRNISELISDDSVSMETVALAFATDRRIHLERRIIPWLKTGHNVVCDRYVYSSIAYQSTEAVGQDWIEKVNRSVLKPDIAVLIDVNPETAISRLNKRDEKESYERKDFLKQVRAKYLDACGSREEFHRVDGSGEIEEVSSNVLRLIRENLSL